MAEVGRHLGRQVRPRALEVQVDDTDVAQLRGARNQGVEQERGRGRGALDVDLVAGPDARRRLLRATRYACGESGSGARRRSRPDGTERGTGGPDGVPSGLRAQLERRPRAQALGGVPYRRISSRTAPACSVPSSGRATAAGVVSPIVIRQAGAARRFRAQSACGEPAATTSDPSGRSTNPTTARSGTARDAPAGLDAQDTAPGDEVVLHGGRDADRLDVRATPRRGPAGAWRRTRQPGPAARG